MWTLRVALLGASGGALLAMIDLGAVGTVAGLALVVLGTIVVAPMAPSGGWWNLMAAGAALTLTAALISLVAAPLGGLLTVLGGVLVLTGAAFGYR